MRPAMMKAMKKTLHRIKPKTFRLESLNFNLVLRYQNPLRCANAISELQTPISDLHFPSCSLKNFTINAGDAALNVCPPGYTNVTNGVPLFDG